MGDNLLLSSVFQFSKKIRQSIDKTAGKIRYYSITLTSLLLLLTAACSTFCTPAVTAGRSWWRQWCSVLLLPTPCSFLVGINNNCKPDSMKGTKRETIVLDNQPPYNWELTITITYIGFINNQKQFTLSQNNSECFKWLGLLS